MKIPKQQECNFQGNEHEFGGLKRLSKHMLHRASEVEVEIGQAACQGPVAWPSLAHLKLVSGQGPVKVYKYIFCRNYQTWDSSMHTFSTS